MRDACAHERVRKKELRTGKPYSQACPVRGFIVPQVRSHARLLIRAGMALLLFVACGANPASSFGPVPGPMSAPPGPVTVASSSPMPLPPPEQVLPPPGFLCRLFSPVVDVLDRSALMLSRAVAVPFSALDRLMERCCPASRPAGVGLPLPPSGPSPRPACPTDRPKKCPLL